MTGDVLDYVLANLPSPPARVLEVGAGKGELAAALREAGYEVVAVDPSSEAPGVTRVALVDVDEPARSFDAAVAVVSLHHVDPLAESCAHLAELVAAGGRLVVEELDSGRFDELAAAGADRQLHPVAEIRDLLGAWFDLGPMELGARFVGVRKS